MVEKEFTSSREITVEKVKLLLASGADINIQNNQGQSALIIARKFGDQTVVKLLEVAQRP